MSSIKTPASNFNDGEIEFNFSGDYLRLLAYLVSRGTSACLNKNVEEWLLILKSIFVKVKIFEKRKDKILEIETLITQIENDLSKTKFSHMSDIMINKILNKNFSLCFELEEKVLRMTDDNKMLMKRLPQKDLEALRESLRG